MFPGPACLGGPGPRTAPAAASWRKKTGRRGRRSGSSWPPIHSHRHSRSTASRRRARPLWSVLPARRRTGRWIGQWSASCPDSSGAASPAPAPPDTMPAWADAYIRYSPPAPGSRYRGPPHPERQSRRCLPCPGAAWGCPPPPSSRGNNRRSAPARPGGQSCPVRPGSIP